MVKDKLDLDYIVSCAGGFGYRATLVLCSKHNFIILCFIQIKSNRKKIKK